VIITGCREELQLKKLQHEVALEVEALKDEKKTDYQELSSKITLGEAKKRLLEMGRE
jgi:hypothetical protein